MDSIEKELFEGNYEKAAEKCERFPMNEIKEMLMEIAYKTESIVVYGFCCHMIYKKNTPEWHELALNIMLNPLCFIEGAYSIALHHARELLVYDKNVENLESLLFFYEIPEKLLGYEEAISIVNDILAMDPENEVARKIEKGRQNGKI